MVGTDKKIKYQRAKCKNTYKNAKRGDATRLD